MSAEDETKAPPGVDQDGAQEGQSGSGETEDKGENKPNGGDSQAFGALAVVIDYAAPFSMEDGYYSF